MRDFALRRRVVVDRSKAPRAGLIFCLGLLVLASSLLLGGGTRSGFLSDSILQLVSIPLLLASLWRMIDVHPSNKIKRTWLFCLALALVPLVQLIPMPPQVWTALPSREVLAEPFDLLRKERPWMPISVSPRATWLSALSLLVPLAVFLGTLLLSYRERRLLSLAILAVGIVSVFLGLIQVAQGPSSPLRFFEVTNPSEAVGFFANRNHFAALLYCLMVFAAAWVVSTENSTAPNRGGHDTTSVLGLIVGFTVIVVLVVGQAIARSRAGLGLSIVALFGAFALALSNRGSMYGRPSTKLLLGAFVLALMLATQFGLYRILDRFTTDPLADARLLFARNTIEAAKAFMPLGSGIGSFVQVYALFESPADLLNEIYVNRAHNDLLELWLETGAVGIALTTVFVAWWVLRVIEMWRRPPAAAREIDQLLARAATIAIALIIAHSLVDYPLRTSAMMAIMAFACALLLEPVTSGADTEPQAGEQRTAPRSDWRPDVHATAPPECSSAADKGVRYPTEDRPPPVGRWGEDIEWPQEWRGPSSLKE